jgi:hypothetical protein
MEIVNIVMSVIMAILTIVILGMCVATYLGLAGIVAAAETALMEERIRHNGLELD